jgi:hypothetical protein
MGMKNPKEILKKLSQEEPSKQVVDILIALVNELWTEIEKLRDEVAQLKNQPPRPKIEPSNLEKAKKHTGNRKDNWTKGSKNQKLIIDREEKIEISPDQIPQGAIFKGYKSHTVQELIIRTENTRYLLAQWQLSDGRYISAKLPAGLEGQHFGPGLRAHILYQHHSDRVPQNRIEQGLKDKGVKISKGQVNEILIKEALKLKQEKEDLLRAGLKSAYVQTDDTGARHKGENGVATVIGNKFFTYIKSTRHKSRINFLEVLSCGKIEYTITNSTLDYIKNYKQADLAISKLQILLNSKPMNSARWEEFLKKHEFGKDTRRILTEGALIGTLVAREIISPEIILMSDGARQFHLFVHILCWIHVERSIKKLIPINETDRFERETILEKYWDFYRDLKAYKEMPTDAQKIVLNARFDEIFSFRASEPQLAQVLKKIRDQKPQLLLVLDHPDVPLHNNMSEGDIREYVTKRKISGGTRSDAGRDARDTVISLLKTCKKLGINFWEFLHDRLNKINKIPPFAELIRIKIAEAVAAGH